MKDGLLPAERGRLIHHSSFCIHHSRHVLVEQPGVLATLSRWRPWVQIPSGTLQRHGTQTGKATKFKPSCLWVRLPPVLLMRVSQAQRGLISLARRVRPPNPLLTDDWVRKLAKPPATAARRCPTPGACVHVATTLVTTIPWSNGYDAWMTPRREMVRLHPGSFPLGNADLGLRIERRQIRIPQSQIRNRNGL